MINETRNELLYINNIINTEGPEKDAFIALLLERFYYDIKDQLSDLGYKKEVLESNMELLKYIINNNDQLKEDRTLKKIIDKK